MLNKSLYSLLILFFLGFFIPKTVQAEEIFFQDNFDNPTESSGRWIMSGPQLKNGDDSNANWRFENNMCGMIVQNKGGQYNELIPKNWNASISDYTFEVDWKIVNGVDTNLVFRYQNHDNWYGVHGINSENRLVLQKYGSPWATKPPEKTYHFTPNLFYHYRVDVKGDNLKIFINGEKIWDITDTGTILTWGMPGLQASTGGVFSVEVWFDNVVVRTVDTEEPPLQDLNVPLLKQTDSLWNPPIYTADYNSASQWSPGKTTIGDWGCALTCGAMILKYYGLNKIDENTDLTPGSLNNWLKNQEDGYRSNGWINWIALSRLSKEIKTLNNILDFDALEYEKRIEDTGLMKNQLTTDLNNKQPDILEVPGHFIVAKGINNDSFTINDPYYTHTSLKDGYSNNFLTLGRYVPSKTDLSYILVDINEEANITLYNTANQSVAPPQSTEQPFINDGNNTKTNGKPMHTIYYPKPDSGEYVLQVDALPNQPYDIDIYLYDINGKVKKYKVTGSITDNEAKMVKFNYDKLNSQNSSLEQQEAGITFDKLIKDTDQSFSTKQIRNYSLYITLRLKAQSAKFFNKVNKYLTRMFLNSFIKELNKQRGKGVKEEAYQLLSADANYLLNHL